MTLSVLHVHSGNMLGGIESVLLAIAEQAARSGAAKHTFAVCFEGTFSQQLARHGCEVKKLPGVRLSRPWTAFSARRALRALLDEGRFDTVICHSPWSHLIFAPVVAASDTALVFWMHGIAAGRTILERLASRHSADLAIANSGTTSDSLATIFPGVSVEIVHNPVSDRSKTPEVAGASDTRASLGIREDQVVVLMVARLEAGKGQETLIRALGHLRDEESWRCWITAVPQRPEEERYLQRIRTLAQGLGIGNRISFVGPQRPVADLYAAADIFSHPNSVPEGFGMVFIEALQFSLPVVTTAHGGALDIIDDSCGIMVPPDQPAELAAALCRLLDDRNAREALGNAGPARAREIADPSRQEQRLLEALARIPRLQSVAPSG